MTEEASKQTVPIPADQVNYLIATAARAPSVHNTQPWRFRASDYAIDLYADPCRKLQVDRDGREMVISCGAALFGLRLAVRALGYLPIVEPFPDPPKLRLLARVRIGGAAPMTPLERQMLEALPHRHTHRGAFAPGPLPAGLLSRLQHDALAEGATLALIDRGSPTSGWPTSPAPPTAGSTATWMCGRRYSAGAGTRRSRSGRRPRGRLFRGELPRAGTPAAARL